MQSPEVERALALGAETTTDGERKPRRTSRDFFPQPFELLAILGALGALLFLRVGGFLNLGWSSIGFTVGSVAPALPLFLACGILMRCVATAVGGGSVRGYLREIATRHWFVEWARVSVAMIAFIYAYIWLKVSVPLVRQELFDLELWRLDRALHFGFSPTILAVELTRGTVLTGLLDRWYALFVLTAMLGFAYIMASTRSDARRSFFFASAVLWIVGAGVYLAVPALGPCYATPEVREPIRAEMPRAAGAQDALFGHYGRMIQSRGRFLASFDPSLGVAAMPSLHVGAHWLLALWARRYERRLFLPFALATALTFFGSLVSTWHYAVDGYAGLLLAWLAIAAADRLQPAEREDGPEQSDAHGRPVETTNEQPDSRA